MLTLNPLFELLLTFSHTHCVAICAVLVPLNLLTTLQTLVSVGMSYSTRRLYLAAGLAVFCASLLLLHVGSWFIVGVVRVQTFVLLSLGAVCLGLNGGAIAQPQQMRSLLHRLSQWVAQTLKRQIVGGY